MAEQKFKIGDVVQIAPNNRSLDCCGGKRGRIYGHAAWDSSLFILNTDDHFCPVGRSAEELTLVPALELAKEYFEIEGWDVYEDYKATLANSGLTLQEISTAANNGNPDCRHFLVVYLAEITKEPA